MVAPLLIADVPWLLYRSYFALPKSIKGSGGKPVNALLGTANALLGAVEAKAPRTVVACFGAQEARYRVELYPPYHAHRDPMPKELAEQWTRAPELLASFGWTVAEAGELEADDAMGSFARVESQAGGRGLLLTADRDLYQAVDERVAVLNLESAGVFAEVGPEQVIGRYAIAPERVPDFIALRGDPSDGIPGAPGIGAKTAAELLQRYGTLEEVLEAAGNALVGDTQGTGAACREDEHNAAGKGASRATNTPALAPMRPRIAATLNENAELLRTFKQVATLVEIDVERPDSAPTDYASGASAARAIGMNRLAERLERMVVGSA